MALINYMIPIGSQTSVISIVRKHEVSAYPRSVPVGIYRDDTAGGLEKVLDEARSKANGFATRDRAEMALKLYREGKTMRQAEKMAEREVHWEVVDQDGKPFCHDPQDKRAANAA